MLSPGAILLIGGLYLGGLFLIAFVVDRLADRDKARFMASPLIYTLSLAIYCTSWTFYGAVGSAARNGLEFVTIYLGPTLVFMGWWVLLRRLVRISKAQKITSIADFLSARYGKSAAVSVLVTIVAVVGITPYIALQLMAVATSFDALAAAHPTETRAADGTLLADTGLWVAALMAVFVILFGTRNLNADESHPGVIAAIAFESLVKLVALVAIGLFVIFGLNGGIGAVFAHGAWNAQVAALTDFSRGYETRWVVVTFLSAAAIVCLPRQFQVAVVENRDEHHLATAAWLFPLYLFLITLFVVPIAIAGLTTLPETANPDLYVLSVPLAAGHYLLALFAFIGGLSAATSMVIVSSIALSIMVSNHLVGPILLRLPIGAPAGRTGLTPTLLMVRRAAILVIIPLGYLYYRGAAPSGGLASIGLISFAGVAQFVPALVGGLFWRSATRQGALTGLLLGFALWLVTLFLPSVVSGPHGFGLLALLQETLIAGTTFGGGVDPLVFGLAVSLGANTLAYVLVSLWSTTNAMDRLQSTLFVDILKRPATSLGPALPRSASAADLFRLVERILGFERAREIVATPLGASDNAVAEPQLIAHVERQLATAIGAASAQLMVSRIAKGEAVSVDAAIQLLDETHQVVRYSRELERKSRELEETAAQLRAANAQLKQLDRMKDDFLSEVSHELRTPMTSIRSFSQILVEERRLDSPRARRFIDIIAEESARMTRLLDNILDVKRMESGQVDLASVSVDLRDVVHEAAAVMGGLAERQSVRLECALGNSRVEVVVDPDRLKQVIINLLSNAIKFMDGDRRTVRVTLEVEGPMARVRVADSGPGIDPEVRPSLFTTFARGWKQRAGKAKGSGLGLAISRQIVTALGGDIRLEDTGPEGSTFTLRLPLARQPVAARTARHEAAE